MHICRLQSSASQTYTSRNSRQSYTNRKSHAVSQTHWNWLKRVRIVSFHHHPGDALLVKLYSGDHDHGIMLVNAPQHEAQ